tara:strand:- start:1 stop:510 length:510 start_codon:yes stop_codon:yes gene_type:complete
LKNLFPARVICPWTMAGKWQSFNDLKYASFVDAGTTLPQAGGSASHSFSRPGSPTYIWDEDQDRFLTLPTVFEITNKGGALLNPPLFLRLSAFHDAWKQFMYRFFGGAGWIKALAGRMDAFHLAIYGALRLRRERLADLFSFGFSFAREIPRFRKKRHFCLKKVFTGLA